jgi:hypothetical protein
MKRTHSATHFSWKAFVLSGGTALVLSTVAIGQANPPDRDRPLSDRPASDRPINPNPNAMDQDHQTFEGQIKPLFDVLSNESATAPSSLQPGSRPQPGGLTQPGSADQPGRVNPPGSPNQPGVKPQDQTSASGNRALGAGGINPSPVPGSAMTQPLALICASDSKPETSSSSARASTGEGRPSTAVTSPQRTTSTTATGEGEVYVLVFDPADPQSRTAYQMAQSIAGSQHRSGTVPETSGSIRTTPSSTTPGAPGASATDKAQRDQQPGQQPGVTGQPRSTDYTSTGMDKGSKVKITGRVIERDGIQAIAVHRVERQHDDATGSTQPYRGGQ